MDRMTKPKVQHIGDGVLALDLPGFETAVLYPDGPPGRFRAAHPMIDGGRAVIAAEDGRLHLWASILHLEQR
jgi:hypothetical protein